MARPCFSPDSIPIGRLFVFHRVHLAEDGNSGQDPLRLGGRTMLARWMPGVVAGVVGFVLWAGSESAAQAQMQPPPAPIPNLNRFYYYPYYFFPHNYWPTQGPKWPEPVGAPY